MVGIQTTQRPEKPLGQAAILALSTANPSNVVDQSTFTDYYFRMTKNEDDLTLKEKFKRISTKTTVRKRHVHLTEEILKENPSMCEYKAPSMDARQEIIIVEVLECCDARRDPIAEKCLVVFSVFVEMPKRAIHQSSLSHKKSKVTLRS